MHALLLAGALALGDGLEVPAADGWVTDLADLLSAEEELSLESLMESYRTGSGHEIALLTLPSLEGESLEDFALQVAREWGLGREDVHDGALLLVAVAERRMRIEVGRGLEGSVTDSISGRIIRDVIGPEFRDKRFGAGLRAGVEALHAAAGGDYGPVRRAERGEAGAGSGACLSLVVVLFVLLALGRARRGRGRGRGLGSVLPWILLGQLSSAGRTFGGGSGRSSSGGFGGFGGGSGGFGGFGGGGGFSGGGASGGW